MVYIQQKSKPLTKSYEHDLLAAMRDTVLSNIGNDACCGDEADESFIPRKSGAGCSILVENTDKGQACVMFRHSSGIVLFDLRDVMFAESTEMAVHIQLQEENTIDVYMTTQEDAETIIEDIYKIQSHICQNT